MAVQAAGQGEAAMANEVEALRAEVARLQSEIERMTRGAKSLSAVIHNMTVANQSAWIEWRHGEGAEAAMVWVHNGLAGPGLIPDEDEPYGKEAQAWYDKNNADPLPACHCGRPSNIAWMGGGACSEAHYREAKARQDADAANGVQGRDALPELLRDGVGKAAMTAEETHAAFVTHGVDSVDGSRKE